ncbi:hypothetical protein AMELA_G00232170 [Ameiurus melas]|uniref:Uncharacterized protein n=1 Tax=Ameiurus melas TaxID=219545 RepID=A0A7J5ZX80_AMEME|nr:hypothetical protein AMELA_G00232170 [Ameiurus melas]
MRICPQPDSNRLATRTTDALVLRNERRAFRTVDWSQEDSPCCILGFSDPHWILTWSQREHLKLKMEQMSDDELDHAAEEDSDKEDQDLDKMSSLGWQY